MSGASELHVVSFDIPYPPVYGGVIDVYYKIKALAGEGIKVHLHCFQYGGKKPVVPLEDICASVHYYKRKPWLTGISKNLPYIICSRRSKRLLKNLSADGHPVLFEGMHTCYYLDHPALARKTRMVRMHNLEWDYYAALANAAGNPLKKFYYQWEAGQLLKFSDKLKAAHHLLTISPSENKELKKNFPQSCYLPAFHANSHVTSRTGTGKYALYQAKLSVPENEEAALFLVSAFRQLDFPLVIAGSGPSARLIKAIKPLSHVQVIANPDEHRMKYLTMGAQMNLLPTFQSTGIKLKLINALYQGRWCVANDQMVQSTHLEGLCNIANTAGEFVNWVNALRGREFNNGEIRKRSQVMGEHFSNEKNAKKLLELVSGQKDA